MYRRFSDFVLRWAKVTPRPEPPMGAPGSARTFRAGRNYYYFRLLGWGGAQIGAAIGLTFSIGFVASLDAAVQALAVLRARPVATTSPTPAPPPGSPDGAAPQAASPAPASRSVASDLRGVRDFSEARDVILAINSAGPPDEATVAPTDAIEAPSPTPSKPSRTRRNLDGLARTVQRMPPLVYWSLTTWVVPFLRFLEVLGIATFLALLPATYALARIEYEQHWYIVTDRSLRIRTGVLSLSESTMSFANLQQVEVKQGPLQRLLGLADVRVQSAGGGSSEEHGGEALHTGVFRSVENAPEIRDLIVARLRAFREAGLGDPDHARRDLAPATGAIHPQAVEAAREVLRESRALRAAALGSRSRLAVRPE